jgi:two-component system chemotaxis response regulator CheY
MKTCLIVDDSRIIRKISRQILESVSFTCTEAENGQVALDHCRRAMPRFVLLDWNMPVMDGLTFLRQLRSEPHGNDPKVLLCTVETTAERIREALAAGADEYVMKPFDADILESRLLEAGVV